MSDKSDMFDLILSSLGMSSSYEGDGIYGNGGQQQAFYRFCSMLEQWKPTQEEPSKKMILVTTLSIEAIEAGVDALWAVGLDSYAKQLQSLIDGCKPNETKL